MYSRRRSVFAPRKRRHPLRWIFLTLLTLVILCGVYTAIDNGRIIVKTQRVLVHDLPKALEGYTVLHISDLGGAEFGPGQKQLTNALKNKRYSAVCITGNMVGPKGETYPFYDLLSALDPTKPVFFVAGKNDPSPLGDQASGGSMVLAEWVLGAQSRGAKYLGAPQSLTVGGSKVWFTDASQMSLDLESAAAAYATADTPLSRYYAENIELTTLARMNMAEDDLVLALSHTPIGGDMLQIIMTAETESTQQFVRSVDLVLAGGTNGGQWRIPFMGPLWSDGWFPQEELTEGYHYAGSLLQYISGGLGVNPNSPLLGFRLFNAPEVTLITFTAEMDVDVLP